ncbi:hypothetical protein BIWAKO_05600 [Bosea sp. BIWAKO-01]|nr:hypothetical protein BIWAKO_05600 [Bosea sp. BIWAKO-01]
MPDPGPARHVSARCHSHPHPCHTDLRRRSFSSCRPIAAMRN